MKKFLKEAFRSKLATGLKKGVCAALVFFPVHMWAQTTNTLFNSETTTTSYDVLNQNSGDGFSLGIDPESWAFVKQKDDLPLLFYTNNLERMRMLSSGLIGINETNPLAQVDIAGDLRIQTVNLDANPQKYLTIDNQGLVKYANASAGGGGNFWALTGNAGTSATTNYCGTSDNQDFIIRSNNTPIMAVLDDKVQIGGVSNFFNNDLNTSGLINGPAKVNVYGFNGFYARMTNPWGTTAGSVWIENQSTTGLSSFRMHHMGSAGTNEIDNSGGQFSNEDDLFLLTRGSRLNECALNIDKGGDVKIGFFENDLVNNAIWPNPELNLVVTASMAVGAEIDPNYTLYINGDAYVSSGSWSGSDARFKEDVEEVDGALEDIQKLRPVTYQFKTEEFKEKRFSDRKATGLIAQELEEVFPNMVKTDAEGYKAVNYTELIPVLVSALQEQQEQIQTLQAELSQLTEASPYQNSIETSEVVLRQSHPNPTKGYSTIVYDLPTDKQGSSLRIMDMQGRVVFNQLLHSGRGEVEVDTKGWAAGAYQYAIVFNHKVLASEKMLVEK